MLQDGVNACIHMHVRRYQARVFVLNLLAAVHAFTCTCADIRLGFLF